MLPATATATANVPVSTPRPRGRWGRRGRTVGAAVVSAIALLAGGGCVDRIITITSDPPGALVHVNDREIGRTPVETRFVHYGTFDVRLRKEGYEPLLTVGDANPPLWDRVPLDFGAELLPVPLTARVAWHYELEPVRDGSAGLVERARQLREQLGPDDRDAEAGVAVEGSTGG